MLSNTGSTETDRLYSLYRLPAITAILLSRVRILTRGIDIANLSVCPSVRDVTVSNENGLTYRQRFVWYTLYGGTKYRWGI